MDCRVRQLPEYRGGEGLNGPLHIGEGLSLPLEFVTPARRLVEMPGPGLVQASPQLFD